MSRRNDRHRNDLPLSLLHWKDTLRQWIKLAEQGSLPGLNKDASGGLTLSVSLYHLRDLADAIELAEPCA